MNKKILVIAVALMFAAMMVAPVAAAGPIKANIDKNKNLVFYNESPSSIMVRLINQGAVMHEWINPATTREWHLQRRDASKVNIGNALEGQFDTVQANLPVFLEYENKWLYLTQDQYSNMLQGFGFTEEVADGVASGFPDGVYFKVNFIG
jgi:hypothetical protein